MPTQMYTYGSHSKSVVGLFPPLELAVQHKHLGLVQIDGVAYLNTWMLMKDDDIFKPTVIIRTYLRVYLEKNKEMNWYIIVMAMKWQLKCALPFNTTK